ncbi:MAG: GerMN domain-containing protein [Minisyncoccia bacterium]
MANKLIITGVVILAGLTGYYIFHSPGQEIIENSFIKISSPEVGEIISSPLKIQGVTKSGWVVFEAQAGAATLFDANGNKLGMAILRAVGEWMKPEVNFEGTLVFTNVPKTETGKLIFKDDNPKDESEAKTYEMPIRFESFSKETRKVNLYYYNETKDREIADYIPCGRDAVLQVERAIPISQTPVQDAVNLLLKGGVSDEEKLAGFKTEFPLSGLKLIGANLNNGTLTLKFDDPENKSGGGSCRVGLLWAQISKTALQFPEVKEVKFEPAELFQP